jgi:hypothetical protein
LTKGVGPKTGWAAAGTAAARMSAPATVAVRQGPFSKYMIDLLDAGRCSPAPWNWTGRAGAG